MLEDKTRKYDNIQPVKCNIKQVKSVNIEPIKSNLIGPIISNNRGRYLTSKI